MRSHNRSIPRMVRAYTFLRFHSALTAQRQALHHGDPKRVASTRRELIGATTSPQDRSLAALALA